MKTNRKTYAIFGISAALLLPFFSLGCGTKQTSVEVSSDLTENILKEQDHNTPGWQNKKAAVFDSPAFELQGTSITLPCSYDTLQNGHFSLKADDADTTVDAQQFYSAPLYDASDEMVAYLYLSNFTDSSQKASSCTVTGISISPNEAGFSENIRFSLENGISFADNSDAAIAALGLPGDAFESSGDIVSLTWYGEEYETNFYDSLTLTYEKEKLTSVCLFYQGKQ